MNISPFRHVYRLAAPPGGALQCLCNSKGSGKSISSFISFIPERILLILVPYRQLPALLSPREGLTKYFESPLSSFPLTKQLKMFSRHRLSSSVAPARGPTLEESLLSASNSGGALMKSLLARCLCLAETLSEWEMWQ